MGQWKVVPEIKMYFATTTIVGWTYVFTSIPYFEAVIESLRFCIKNKGLHLHGFVIMPNHAHYIMSADDGKNLSDVMRDFGTHTSREITGILREERREEILQRFRDAAQADGRGNEFKVWIEGFHPIAIESEKFFRQKVNYLHENPVRKGYVEEPEHWKYSSARNYILNDESIIRVEML